MPVQQTEVGPVYDLLLQTRDGTTLPCKNKDGQIVNVSQIAYVTSIDRNAQGQHEETEIQHKDQIVQLGSPNLIDREFEQWPQVSQGDWSGGMLQRVFTGATPISGGAESDPTRYWDGSGVLWPTFDFSLQGGLALSPLVDTANTAAFSITGPAAGIVNGTTQILFIEHDVTAAKWFLVAYDATNTRTTLDITAQTPAAGWQDLFVFTNWAWLVDASIPSKVYYASTTGGLGINAFVTFPTGQGGFQNASTAIIGNQNYVAIRETLAASANTIRIYNTTNIAGINPVSTSVVPLSFDSDVFVNAMEFLGDNLVFSVTDNNATSIVQYNIPSATFTRVASIPQGAVVVMTVVAGSLFILASTLAFAGGTPVTVEMYLLQGGSLQDIGPLTIQLPNGSTAFILSTQRPVAYGPYAVFGVGVKDLAGLQYEVIMLYDVLRGRLFKLSLIQNTVVVSIDSLQSSRIALLTSFSRPFQSAQRQSAFEVIYPLHPPQSASAQVLQEVLVGVQNLTGPLTPVVQQGISIISSIIDFTSASPKLYRQVVAKFTAMPNDANITVKLDVWLDQDVAALAATPDFTSTLTGSSSTAGVTKFSLPINKIATKLVYRVTTTGGTTISTGTNLRSAVKLISVVVQAAAGWVQTLKLDLAPNAQINTKNGNVWERQSLAPVTVDQAVAYNFLRQLWRLKGGEVFLALPNGDSGNWLIQDLAFDSPKPMAASFRGDQQTQYQVICTAKFREDL